MAKKTAIKRLQPTTPEELKQLAKRFRKYAAKFDGLAAALDLTEEKVAHVEGYAMLDRGLVEVEKFIANCQKKIREYP